MTATDKTLDLGGKEHLEWHGCDLNLLSTYDHPALRAIPTMEAQKAWQVMANMFDDDGSILLTSFVVLNMVKHSGISKHDLRLPGVQS